MRRELRNKEGVRETFTGTFVRFGTKKNWHGFEDKTILLNNIKTLCGENVTDHLWFNFTKQFEKVDLKENDVVEFDARVKRYKKGYQGYRDDVYKPVEIDYKLSHPTKIKILK